MKQTEKIKTVSITAIVLFLMFSVNTAYAGMWSASSFVGGTSELFCSQEYPQDAQVQGTFCSPDNSVWEWIPSEMVCYGGFEPGQRGENKRRQTCNPVANVPPSVGAGSNQTITLPTNSVTLSGSANDPDGFIVSRTWTLRFGPGSPLIASPNTDVTTVNNLIAGLYGFRFTATDNGGASSYGDVQVTVNPEPVEGQTTLPFFYYCGPSAPVCYLATEIYVTITTNKYTYSPGEDILVNVFIWSDDVPQNTCPPTLYLSTPVRAVGSINLPCTGFQAGVNFPYTFVAAAPASVGPFNLLVSADMGPNYLVPQGKNIALNVALPTYTLTTSIASGVGTITGPGGISCPGTCSATFPAGTPVMLTATANPGTHTFGSWTGVCTGSPANCSIATMDGNKVTAANFTANTYTLTVNSSGASAVLISSSSGDGGTTSYTRPSLALNSSRVLTAPATSGAYTFSSWVGCSSVTGTYTCNRTMDANRTVTANYTLTPPATPSTLTATPGVCGTGQIALSWTASSGATNYKVYRGATLIYDNSGLSFTDSGLTAGASYTYTVTASNAGGTSAARATSPSSTTAPNVCAPVVTLTASPNSIAYNGSSNLTWTAATNGATSCTGVGGTLAGPRLVTGSTISTGALTSTTNYSITCTGPGGTSAVSSATVMVGAAPADLTAGATTPATATAGTPIAFSSTITNNGGSGTGASFNNVLRVATAADGEGTVSWPSATSLAALGAGGSSVVTHTSHTFPSAGTYSVSTCADNNTSMVGAITETNEGNNCGAWTNVTVAAANTAPTVTSPTATSITTSGATLGANVTSLGIPAAISARGTCWGTTPAPTTNCTTQGGLTTGVFTHARTAMPAGTLIYYRGYAINTTDTGYSPDASFTTTAIPFVYSLSASSGTLNATKASSNVIVQNTVTKTLTSGASQSVTLSASGMPLGVSVAYTNQGCSPTCSSVIDFTIAPSATVGTWPITITGAPLGITATPFNLIISGNPMSVTCTGIPTPSQLGQTITWTANVSGGRSPYTYSWSGDDIPTSPAPSSYQYAKNYSTIGVKTARVEVKDADSPLTSPAYCTPSDPTVMINFIPEFEEF